MKASFFRIPAIPVLIGLFLLVARPSGATVFEVLGVGARSSAMLVGTATAQGPACVFYNPGALTRAEDTEVHAGFQMTQVSLEINGRDIDEEELTTTLMGVVHPTDLLGPKIAIGALLSLPFQRVSRFLTLPLDQPQFIYYGTRNQRLVVTAAGAVQITDWLSVGAGLQVLLDTFSEPDFTLVQDADTTNDFTNPNADALEAQSFGFANAVEQPVLAPAAGILLTPFPGLRLGVTYRGQVKSTISAPLKVTIEEVNLGGLFVAQSRFLLPNEGEVFFSPQQVSGGLAYTTPEETWTVEVDATWFDFSAFPPTFPAGLPSFTGGLGELILPVPGFLPLKPPSKDVVVPALGVEWRPYGGKSMDLWLRGGYAYRPTMLDEDRSLTNYLDTTSHVIGAGFGLEFRNWSRFVPKPLSIDAYAQVHILKERDILKDDLASSRFGDLRIGGILYGGGLEATLRF